MNPFFKFIMAQAAGDPPADPDNAELLIFAAIGDWEDMGEIGAKGFAHELSKLPASVKRLDIHINSPGGSLFEASAIYSRLADHRSEKIVYVDGLAASAASIVAMVGHKIYVRANASMMIHLPSGIVMGNADDMRSMAGALDTVTESMINVYSKRTKLPRAEVRDLLAAETWFTPAQAVEKGFADEVRGVVKAAAIADTKRAIFNGVEFDLSRYRNFPSLDATIERKPMETPTPPAAAATPPADPPTPTPPAPPTPTPPAPPPTPTPPAKPKTEADDAYDKGIKAERDRVIALQALDRPSTHAIVEAAIKDGKQPIDIMAAIVDAMEKASAQANRRIDASTVGSIPGSDGGGAGEGNGFGTLVTNKVKDRLKARGGRSVAHSRN